MSAYNENNGIYKSQENSKVEFFLPENTLEYKFKPYDSIKNFFLMNGDYLYGNFRLVIDTRFKIATIKGYFVINSDFTNNHNTGSNPLSQPSLFYCDGVDVDYTIVYRCMCASIDGRTQAHLQIVNENRVAEVSSALNYVFLSGAYDVTTAITPYPL